jgi:hypothetical protein
LHVRGFDLTAGSTRLSLAWETLQRANAAAAAQWNDATNQHFQDQYYRPLEPKVRHALAAIHRLAEILRKAERECGPDSTAES